MIRSSNVNTLLLVYTVLLIAGVYSQQTIAGAVKHKLSPGSQYMAGAALSFAGVTLFQKLTIKEFLWGYEDPFLKSAKSVFKRTSTT